MKEVILGKSNDFDYWIHAYATNCTDTAGYCVVLGADQYLVSELLARTRFHVIVIDSRSDAVAALRQTLDARGLYGDRVAAFVADPFRSGLPPYLASALIRTTTQELTAEELSAMFRWLRPYGGVAVLNETQKTVTGLAKAAGRSVTYC